MTVLITQTSQIPERKTPLTLTGVKEVKTVLISYTDEEGWEQVQLAIVGENNVHLLSGRVTGTSLSTSQGPATDWLKAAIFERLGISQKKEEKKDHTKKEKK